MLNNLLRNQIWHIEISTTLNALEVLAPTSYFWGHLDLVNLPPTCGHCWSWFWCSYMEAFIWETLRLMPPAYIVGRCACHSTHLGEWHLPVGTTVLVSPYLLHRDPTFWPRYVILFATIKAECSLAVQSNWDLISFLKSELRLKRNTVILLVDQPMVNSVWGCLYWQCIGVWPIKMATWWGRQGAYGEWQLLAIWWWSS